MAFNDLREWIAALDRAGELQRIRAEVDPILEITEITDRVSKGSSKRRRLRDSNSGNDIRCSTRIRSGCLTKYTGYSLHRKI